MPWTETSPRPGRSREELLALVRVKAKAGRRQAQWRTVSALCAVVALIAVASVLGRVADGGERSTVQVAVPAAPTTSAVTPTTAPPSVAGAARAVPPTPCRNSFRPECGPFFWDPPPESDQPLTVKVTYEPDDPRPGEPVRFTVVVADPDARVIRDYDNRRNYGDGVIDEAPSSPVSCAEAFGRWTPPVKVSDRFEATFEHVYSRAGTYTASFSFGSTSGCTGADPYGSRGTGSVTLNVAP